MGQETHAGYTDSGESSAAFRARPKVHRETGSTIIAPACLPSGQSSSIEPIQDHVHCVYSRRTNDSLNGSAETKIRINMGTAAGPITLAGRLYLYFECLRVGVAGFAALARERTSSFVNTAKRNGCDSRK